MVHFNIYFLNLYLTTTLFCPGSETICSGFTRGSVTACWQTPWSRDPQESPRQPVSPDFRQQWSPSKPKLILLFKVLKVLSSETQDINNCLTGWVFNFRQASHISCGGLRLVYFHSHFLLCRIQSLQLQGAKIYYKYI